MALRVWLPLNGDLENKGISNISISTNNFSINNLGKLGKCYQGHGLTHLSQEILNNNWSIALWVKETSAWSQYNQILFCKNLKDSSDCQIYFSIINGKSLNLGINGPSGTGSYNYNFNLNTWYHVAATYDGLNYCLYINGTLVKTGTCTTAFNANKLNLGFGCRSANDNATSGTGQTSTQCFNDFRLYDHCLSPLEVKEISQGLILHYKLNGFSGGVGENLLPNTSFNGISQKYTLNSGTEGGFRYVPISVNRSTLYTISCYLRGNANMTLYRICSGGNESTPWVNRSDMSETEYKYFSITFTSPAAKDISQIYICTRYGTSNSQTGDWFEIKPYSLKMEQGSIATPWIPVLSEIGIDTTKIVDSSGYGNDGTVIDSLTTEISNTDGRYLIATKFPTNTAHIQLPVITYSNFGSSYTFSWWEYLTTVSSSPMPWGFSDGNRLNCYHVNTSMLCWNTSNGTSNPFEPNITSTSLLNGWHHLVITGNGTVTNLYIDGEYKAKAKTYVGLTGTQIWLSGWANATGYSMVNNKMSDFRIYATALSAEDIATLYHTPAQIDNLGGVHGFEMNEISSNILTLKSFEQGGLGDANGAEVALNTRIRTLYLPIIPNAEYKTFTSSGFVVRGVHFYTENQSWISYSSGNSQTMNFIIPESCYYIRIVFQRTNANTELLLSNLNLVNPVLTGIIEKNSSLLNDEYNININKNGIIYGNHFNISKKSGIDKTGIIEATNFIEK